MRNIPDIPRYNQLIRKMRARTPGGLRLDLPTSFRLVPLLLLILFLPSLLLASNLGDTARQFAERIAAATGPGSLALEVANRSSLDERSVREVRSALEAQLRVQGVRTVAADQSLGTVEVVLSESLREYVWTAEITIGSDQPRVILVSQPRTPSGASFTSSPPIVLKKTFLFAQDQPILDAALIDQPGTTTSAAISPAAHLLILDASKVAVYRQQSGRWEPETSLPIQHAHAFPRDVRGRLLLLRDHLFDVYLPGVFCRSSAAAPLTLNCSQSDEPWPLTNNETGAGTVRAFYAPARNFFTGALSPGIGKVSNVPSFYSAAALPRSNYTLWILAAVDGSVHLIDGVTDQAIRSGRARSDLAAVRSGCGVGTQLLVSEAGDVDHDSLRAFEVPDRDPVAVSSPLEFDGPITALWPETTLSTAVTIVKREDTGWYEANRISISCAN